jgi:hypothetical protein
VTRTFIKKESNAALANPKMKGFSSTVRRQVPLRTFNDWGRPPPGYCEADLVAHGGTSVSGAFIQTLTMVDVATGWTECFPLVVRAPLARNRGHTVESL